ncbi:geranylgeranyl transferase type-2 subunit alpha [Magnaporthiopsis poae ATCC 64411]|uniref:Geranylgeranyl transferase type-2 subunit alpha n=1 Tax=Magnaporthiopsis poae (strain ATCC 64411 / 73-15) TaxID=644358 RepID=A0A0C4EDY2_MAGP6|nr:geranylgeranyl transferase type-2 subunit alpha [Magnaporthiopsis poae ATCC 64411]
MASHGVSRSVRPRTEEQRLQEAEKIKKYRGLEAQLRTELAHHSQGPDVFALTSRLLKLNPEYYSVWNDRRRLLISGLLSAPSAGCSRSRASPSSSRTSTTTTSSAASSASSSNTTPPTRASQTTGPSGTTADDGDAAAGTVTGDHPGNGDGDGGDKAKDQDMLRSELAFTIPLLMEFPKCYWIWNYRLWVLQQAVQRLDVPVARRIWEEELGLVGKMLTRDRRNFHAWGYRRHVVAKLESADLAGKSLVPAEFEYTTKMIRVDLSNFSAWHNRSKLIPRLLKEQGAGDAERKKLLDDELKLIRDALNVGPEDQSLWYYHQFLMLNVFDTLGSESMAPNLSTAERVAYVSREMDDIKDLLEDYDDTKWLYEALVEYTVALSRVESRKLTDEELGHLREWLGKLEELDPMRKGRWTDARKEHGLG